MQREVRWWWVRHAPVINPSGNIYGQLDRKADLSNDAAFAALAQRLPRGAAWCVTPLSRTQDTAARLIAEGTDPLGDPAVEPAFLEQSFGDWQGRPHAEVAPRGHLAWLAPATFARRAGRASPTCAPARPRGWTPSPPTRRPPTSSRWPMAAPSGQCWAIAWGSTRKPRSGSASPPCRSPASSAWHLRRANRCGWSMR